MKTASWLDKNAASCARPIRDMSGDVTYIATGDGWLYLAVLLDLFSRRVVG